MLNWGLNLAFWIFSLIYGELDLDTLTNTWVGDTLDWLAWGFYYLPLDFVLICINVVLVAFMLFSIAHVLLNLL